MKEIIVNGINLRLANPELGLREGMYYVSKNGDVYSMFVKRFLIPTLNEDNYMMIQFRTNDKKTDQIASRKSGVGYIFRNATPRNARPNC